MTTITNNRRIVRTGRPLGLLDVISKLVETGLDAITPRKVERSVRSDAAVEAAQLRRFAANQRKWSPGFADDLVAAADRHERNSEG